MASPRMMLRSLIAIAATLGAAAFVFGFFPGLEVYAEDGTYLGTHRVVEHANEILGVVVLYVAPGAVIWRRPRIGSALLWPLWAILITVLWFITTIDLDGGGLRHVALWPHAVFGYLMSALVILVIAGVPIACGVWCWIARARTRPPALPTARLVKTRA